VNAAFKTWLSHLPDIKNSPLTPLGSERKKEREKERKEREGEREMQVLLSATASAAPSIPM